MRATWFECKPWHLYIDHNNFAPEREDFIMQGHQAGRQRLWVKMLESHVCERDDDSSTDEEALDSNDEDDGGEGEV